jgi:hypothetical protein
MSTLHFRILVVLVMLLCILGGAIDFIFSNELVENISSYASNLQPELEGKSLSVFLVVAIPAIICMVGSFIGLLMLKPWGRTLFLCGFFATLPLYFFSGISIESPLSQIFYDLGAYGEGFILAICYFSSFSSNFKKQI